ncbi:hypothetical protein [Streptomyces sp. NPDC003032]
MRVRRAVVRPHLRHRRLLSAVRAAGRIQMAGAHWTLLLTTGRPLFGSPHSQRAQSLYAVLEQVAAQHAVRGRGTNPMRQHS